MLGSSLRCAIAFLLFAPEVDYAGLTSGRPLRFAAFPGDEEIFRARVLPMPLLRLEQPGEGVIGHRRENRALGRALEAYGNSATGDVSALLSFLETHPASGWRASLLGNLGMVWRRAGRYPKSIESLEQAWKLTSEAEGGNARAIGDWVAGELASIHSHLGHGQRVEGLLEQVRGRKVMGPATEKLMAAGEALHRSRSHPEAEYRCGPMAVASLLRAQGRQAPASLVEAKASAQGMSMAQVQRLAREAGVSLAAVAKQRGARIPVPSIMHWRVDHYSAILERRVKGGQESYLVENPLFEHRVWISRDALEDETSGYFLTPEPAAQAGWRTVGDVEAGRVFGRCWRGGVDDEQTRCDAVTAGGASCPNCPCEAPRNMPEYRFQAMVTGLSIRDQPIGYSPPAGPPARFQMFYSQRDAYQPPPAMTAFSNLGPKWTFDWLAWVEDDGETELGRVEVHLRGGGLERYNLLSQNPPAGLRLFTRPHYQSMAWMAVPAGRTTQSYERRLPDGSREVYGLVANLNPRGSERRIFLTEIADAAGNAVRLGYDSRFRMVSMTDAIGQVTRLSYELPADPLKVTRVTDPFGRSASFQYDSQLRLARVTDTLGLSTSFTYDGDFVTSMATPYGTTTFRRGLLEETFQTFRDASRWIEATDPMGETERLEFRSRLRPLPAPEEEGTLYWDKRAWKEKGRDLNTATLIRWKLVGQTVMSGVPWRVKLPLEAEVVFTHPGQAGNAPDQLGLVANLNRTGPDSAGLPETISRLLEDGSTQTSRYQYNAVGRVSAYTDPAGRTFTFAYGADGLDLLEALHGRTRERLLQATYNSQHLPLTITDAARQTTRFTYNARGQMLTATNAKNETTSFAYDAQGYLNSITGAVAQAVTRFSYDRFGRTASVTDAEGYRVSYEYDAADRPVRASYPDGTSEQLRYDRLDPTEFIDRQGRVTRIGWDELRRPVTITDPLGRITRINWCQCGAPEQITDPAGKTTTWMRDIQNRVISKTYADGGTIRYVYGARSGRLTQIVDQKGQITNYEYTADDRVRRVFFERAAVATPALAFSWDADYGRLARTEDGIGITSYSYHPAGVLGALQLAAVEGQFPGSRVEYEYDELARPIRRSINGVSSAAAYDALGRITRATNALGDFSAGYQGASSRTATVQYPNGYKALLEYFDGAGDFRLRRLRYESADGGLLSQFGYTYEPTGEIKTLVRYQAGLDPATGSHEYSYDAAGQLTAAGLTAEDGSTLWDLRYEYDLSGNRTSENSGGDVRTAVYDDANQLVSLTREGGIRQLRYDANGNLVSDGAREFEWDALNRLVGITEGSRRTEFRYDALDRRVTLVEKENGQTRETGLLWCGSEICEQRSGSQVQRRFFPLGETDGEPRFYTRDHLGSIRQVLGAGSVDSRGYDPFGRRSGSGAAGLSFGFTGHPEYAGLALAPFRAYDPELGRWLSRDPVEETAGLNLYAYANNDPVNLVDVLGLDPNQPSDPLKNPGGAVKDWAKDSALSALWGQFKFKGWGLSGDQGVTDSGRNCSIVGARAGLATLHGIFRNEYGRLELALKGTNAAEVALQRDELINAYNRYNEQIKRLRELGDHQTYQGLAASFTRIENQARQELAGHTKSKPNFGDRCRHLWNRMTEFTGR